MKKLSILFVLLCLSSVSIAQEESTITEALTPLGERYVRDYLFVPLRSGATSGHRVVHKGLKSGTLVTLLKVDETANYSLVRTSKGTEGWIPSQYLIEEPTAEIKLKQAQTTISQLTSEAGPISERLINQEKTNQQLDKQVKTLERQNNQLQKELERIKNLSKNAVQLDEQNNSLRKELESVKNKRDTLSAENQRLEDNLKHEGFFNGVFAVILGILATLAIQYLNQSRKRSEWA